MGTKYILFFNKIIIFLFLSFCKNFGDYLKGVEKTKEKMTKIKEKQGEINEDFNKAKEKIDEAKEKINGIKYKIEEQENKNKEKNNRIENKLENIKNESGQGTIFPKKNLKTDEENGKSTTKKEKHFIVSSDVSIENINDPNYYNDYVSQKFSTKEIKKQLKTRVENNKKIFYYWLYCLIIFIVLLLLIFYFFKKGKTIVAFQLIILLCFNLLLNIDLVFILIEKQSHFADIVDIVKDFVFCLIALLMGVLIGMFLMKEYFNKKKMP